MPKLRSKVKRLTNRLKRKNIGTRQTRVRNTRTKKTRVRVTRDRNSRARNTRARKTKIRSKKLRKTIIKKRNRKMLSKHKRGGVIPSRVMNSLNSLNFTTKTRGLYKSGKELANFIVDYLKLTEEETRNMTVGELKELFSEKVLYTSINKGNFIEKPDEVFVDYSNLPSDETKLSDIDSVAERLYENKKEMAQRLYENKKKKAKDDIIKQFIKQSTTGVVTDKEIESEFKKWTENNPGPSGASGASGESTTASNSRPSEVSSIQTTASNPGPSGASRASGESTTASNSRPSEVSSIQTTASNPVSEIQSPESSADESGNVSVRPGMGNYVPTNKTPEQQKEEDDKFINELLSKPLPEFTRLKFDEEGNKFVNDPKPGEFQRLVIE